MTNKFALKQILKKMILTWILLVGVFALLSGAEEKGIIGLIKNSPNAIPWALLLVVLLLVRKKDLIMGMVLLLVALAIILMFSLYESLLVFVLIPVPLFVTGIFLISTWYLHQHKGK